MVESYWFYKPSNLSDAILTWQALGLCSPFCQGNGYKKTPCPLLELHVGVGGIEGRIFASEKGETEIGWNGCNEDILFTAFLSLKWWATSWKIHCSLSILFSTSCWKYPELLARPWPRNSQCCTHCAEQDQWRHGARFGARVGCGKPKNAQRKTWETRETFGVFVEKLIIDAGSTAVEVYKSFKTVRERERESSY